MIAKKKKNEVVRGTKTINNSCGIISILGIMVPDVKMRSRTLSITLCVCNILGDHCGSILHCLYHLD